MVWERDYSEDNYTYRLYTIHVHKATNPALQMLSGWKNRGRTDPAYLFSLLHPPQQALGVRPCRRGWLDTLYLII